MGGRAGALMLKTVHESLNILRLYSLIDTVKILVSPSNIQETGVHRERG